MITMTLAHADVTDLDASERWYCQVFAAPPDTRPMDGLIEWRFGPTHGVQVFEDAERAGNSTVVVAPTDFDDVVGRLDDAGIEHSGVQPGGGGRLISLSDPDGNRVVLLDVEAAAIDDRSDLDVQFATLRFERRVDASIDRIWEAHADVGQRTEWSVPEGEAVVYDSSDFTPGGCDELRCGPPDDLANHVITRYLRIDAPHSYVATNEIRRNGDPVAADTTHFRLRADGDATVLTMIVQVTSLVGAGLLDGYQHGHEGTLDSLERFLA